MANDWILDVIRDLRRFAELNDLPELSNQLGAAAETAHRELSRKVVAPGGKGLEGNASGVDRLFKLAAGQDV